MRKSLVLALLLTIALVGSVSIVPVRAAPVVLNVGPGQPFPLISAALAVALPGDSIHVWDNPGIPYVENPQILPHLANIKIIGQSLAGVTIQAAAGGPCFAVHAPGVMIANLQIVCPVVAGQTFGIYILTPAMQCRILNTKILNFDYGIVIDDSPDNQVIGNEISNCVATPAPPPFCSTGVYIIGSAATGNVVRGNEFGFTAPNWFAVGTNGASGNTITFNNFWMSMNVPQAFTAPTDVNIWHDAVLPKGNFWNDPLPKPPYVINPNNFDKFCSPGPYNWAAMSWDINRDGRCDIKDLSMGGASYGSSWSTLRWNPIPDLNLDAKIDIKDLAFMAKYYGWTDP